MVPHLSIAKEIDSTLRPAMGSNFAAFESTSDVCGVELFNEVVMLLGCATGTFGDWGFFLFSGRL